MDGGFWDRLWNEPIRDNPWSFGAMLLIMAVVMALLWYNLWRRK